MSRTLLKTKAVTFAKKYAYFLAFLAIVGGSSAFKMVEKMDKLQSTTHWYAVTYNPSTPGDLSQQMISGVPLDDDPASPCTIRPDGFICAIRLTLPTTTYPVPANVDDALDDTNITNIARARTPDEN